MSQFLICKSKRDLSAFGVPLSKCVHNKSLYNNVVDYYLEGVTDNIWVIEKICDWIYDINNYIEHIRTIARKSDVAIFWYGSEFADLDRVYSLDELMEYIKKESFDSNIELYLMYKRKGQ